MGNRDLYSMYEEAGAVTLPKKKSQQELNRGHRTPRRAIIARG